MRARCVNSDTLALSIEVVVCSFPVSDEESPDKGQPGSIQEPSTDNSSTDKPLVTDDIPNPPKPQRARTRNQGGSQDSAKVKGSSTSKKKKPFVRPTVEEIEATNEYMCQFFSAMGAIPLQVVRVADGTLVEIPLVQPKQIRVPIPYAKDDKGIPVVGNIAEIVSHHVGVLTEDTAMSKIESFIEKYPRIWSAIIIAVSCVAYVRLSQIAGVRHEQGQSSPVQPGQGSPVSQDRANKATTST